MASAAASAVLGAEPKRREIYTYVAPWPVYSLASSNRAGPHAFRLAVGSFIEEYSNKVQVRVQRPPQRGARPRRAAPSSS